MFGFFKKKKKEKKETEEVEEVVEDIPQVPTDGFLRGMYCPVCGYMEVNEASSALPVEGFAICPNCGDQMVQGWFIKDALGFHLAKNADRLVNEEEKEKNNWVTGGHYRVRQAGPCRRDRIAARRMFF